MLEELKATTDRSLANTEIILRSLEPNRTYRKNFSSSMSSLSAADRATGFASTSALDSLLGAGGSSVPFTSSAVLDTSASDFHLRLHKASLSSEFDRFFADVKAELDTRSTQALRSHETLRKEVREELMGHIGGSHEEIAELKQRLAEEREKRVKLDKQMGALLRWQDEAKFGFDDLKRKLEELEETRTTDRRELRKEMVKRSDDMHAAYTDTRKDIDYLRAALAGRGGGGGGKDSAAAGETLKSVEQFLDTLKDRVERLEFESRRRSSGTGISGSDAFGKPDSDARITKVGRWYV
jgi:hypothetical protein